jgi:hypothetical protein
MDRGELPGYEFEVPRGPRHGGGTRPVFGHDSLRPLQPPPPAPEVKSPVRAASSGVFDIMRKRNWVMGLAVPILAAIIVGIAVVVAAGGGGTGGQAPSALAAGFPPARAAGTVFTGTARTPARVTLTAIGASGGAEVTAGGVNGGPALWLSTDGGTDWARAVLGGPVTVTGPGTGQFTGVTDGPAGWLAVGTTFAAGGKPLVASSANASAWTAETGVAALGSGTAMAVAAGTSGYVIVGRQAAGGSTAAAAWYAPGLTGWRQATVAAAGHDMQAMNAVTATAHGFIAVGSTGTSPAAWLSAAGSTWQQVQVPMPAGAARAGLDYVAANGSAVVAAGTEFTAAGVSGPFVEDSADGGATWAEVELPVPDAGTGTGATVTALTAAAGGFTAAGTYVTTAGPEVVIWTLPPSDKVTDGAGWAAVTPQGTGLAGTASENALTALTVDGATLTGVGFSTGLTPAGQQEPTLWQSPVRY